MNSAAHLDRVVALQEAFKCGVINAFAVRILTHALAHGSVWPDDISLDSVPDKDRKCIGNSWRRLRLIGVLAHTHDHRASNAEGANGRIIFRYALADRALAETFLKSNTVPAPATEEQLELMK